jgi:hypothetical protein
MKNWFKLGLVLSPVAIAAQVMVPGQLKAETANDQLLQQINSYSQESNMDSLNQVNSISQLRDVSPGDWAFSALRNLVERYDCLDGYPNRTYRGSRALTRYEFAAGLNACMEQMERLIVNGGGTVEPTDLSQITRLVDEFEAELATLGTRVDNLEGRLGEVEDNQFSTTTKLEGEVVFGITDTFGTGDANNTVFDQRTRLSFVSSFTGKDRLYTRLDQGNSLIDATSAADQQGTLTTSGSSGGSVGIGWLAYYFPIGDSIEVYLPASGGLWQDFVPTVSPYMEGYTGGTAALTSFAESSPIYKLGTNAPGVGANIDLGETFKVSVGYLAPESNSPATSAGLFNGDNTALAQLTWMPSDSFQVAGTYARSYYTGASGNLFLGTGTASANNPIAGAMNADSFGLATSLKISDNFAINAFGGTTAAKARVGAAEADIYYYGLGLSFPNLGKEGNLGGIVVGSEPYVGQTDDTALHAEVFYKYKVNDNVYITPGLVWLGAPDGNKSTTDAFLGTLRTTFVF